MTGAPTELDNNPEPALRFVDSHCHLDDEQFATDQDAVIDAARAAGVSRFVNIGYEPERWRTTCLLADRHTDVSFTLGMHPGSVSQWSPGVADRLQALVRDRRPVAIGEIGIDLFRGEANLKEQQNCFDQQLDIAYGAGLPVVIHMRNAESEVIDLLRSRPANPPLLFHSFEGSSALTNFVLATGSLAGVGGLATRARSDSVREQLQRIPIAQLVLETDAPYLVPAKIKGARNTPVNIPVIARFLAQLHDEPLVTVAATTTRTAHSFFAIPGDS